MSQYIVSARKYRPMTFDAVVGQQALTTTLKNAIASGKLAHAYLFCGPRGVGKTTCARIFAKTINCENRNANGEACDQCESCQAFNEQRSLNIHELDAASNSGVDDMRQLIEQVQVPPQIGRYKVFIVDEVHMLSTAAFNAFLKTLEEPPSHAIFVLATTEKHKILATILSRCQIYDFNRMEIPQIVDHLKNVAQKEGITYDEEGLNVIAQKADGGMRDALSIFDQVASFSQGQITYEKVIEDLNVLDYDYYFRITDEMLKADVPAVMVTLADVLGRGFQGQQFVSGLASHFRNLLMARDPQTLPLLEASDNVRQRYAEQAQRCQPRMLYRALKHCNDCDLNYRQSHNKRLLVELTLIQVAQLSDPQADDAPGSGLGPTRRLKPIFKALQGLAPIAAPQQPTTSPIATRRQGEGVPPQQTPTGGMPQGNGSPTVGMPQGNSSPMGGMTTATRLTTQSISRPLTRISITGRTTAQQTTAQQTVVGQTVPTQTAGTQPQGQVAATPTYIKPATPFTDDELLLAWTRYALRLPREQIANASRMKVMTPVIVSSELLDKPTGDQATADVQTNADDQAIADAQTTDEEQETEVDPIKQRTAYVVEVAVENPRVKADLQKLAPSILNSLCHDLHNEFITLNFRVDDTPDDSCRRLFDQGEILAFMRKEYPALDSLVASLQLELS